MEYFFNNFFFNKILLIRKKQKIRFHKYVNIILIPCIDDYIKYNLINILWYSENDIINFKNSAIIEIKNLINRHLNMSIKDAKYLLYENTKIIYNPSFFY